MPRPKKPAPKPAPAPVAPVAIPAKSDRVFPARKGKDNAALTHERISADLDAFREAGGTIEVLGTTRVLTAIGPADADAEPSRPLPVPPSKPSR